MSQFDELLGPVRESTSTIERAFLSAGDALGEGLSAFADLGKDLGKLVEELGRHQISDAVDTLSRVSTQLTTLSDNIPRDKAALQELATSGSGLGAHLETLYDRTRMLTTLARSARIEAASFGDRGSEFAAFTLEVVHLTRDVQAGVQSCMRDQTRLSQGLGAAVSAQAALERDYRQQVLALAGELREALTLMDGQREKGSRLMATLSQRSDSISGAARTAIISLQAGDTARQRLEHVQHAVMLAAGLDTGEMAAPAEAGSAVALTVGLSRLAGLQLADTMSSFSQDIDSIDDTFRRLSEDTLALVELCAETYGGGSGGAEAGSIEAFGKKVERAANHIRVCHEAVAHVARLIAEVRAGLATLDEAIRAFNDVLKEIMFIGINAGLKAARLGSEGRSLGVIAQELKALASLIADHAREFEPLLAASLEASARFDAHIEATGTTRSLEDELATAVAALKASGVRSDEVLQKVAREGQRFQKGIAGARDRFAMAVASNPESMNAAAILSGIGQDAETIPEEIGQARRFIDAQMMPIYTMARERQVHQEAFADFADPDEMDDAPPAPEEEAIELFA